MTTQQRNTLCWDRDGCLRDFEPDFLKPAFRYLQMGDEAQLAKRQHYLPGARLLLSPSFPKQPSQKRHNEFIFSTKSPQSGEKKKFILPIGKTHLIISTIEVVWAFSALRGLRSRHGGPGLGGKPTWRWEPGPGGCTRHIPRCSELAPALPPHHTQVTSGTFE